MTDEPVVRQGKLRVFDEHGRPSHVDPVELHDVTHLFGDLNEEDTIYRSTVHDGVHVKVKTTRIPGVAGESHFVVTAAVVDSKTGKVLEHPHGPGGKFVLHDNYRHGVMSYAPSSVPDDLLNAHAQVVHYAENAWDHTSNAANFDPGQGGVRVALYDPERHGLINICPIFKG